MVGSIAIPQILNNPYSLVLADRIVTVIEDCHSTLTETIFL